MNPQDRHSEGSQGEPGQKFQALGPRHLHGGQGDHQGDIQQQRLEILSQLLIL